ncbi:MAG: hypothetical protein AMJ46_07255 [Latescibacteria bacterium DG_63]|nr:MAG: hypothetical protein AMJ46_07255 [Latescibacteria bacterium DG_63]
MCENKGGCQKPEQLKGEPEECSPEQTKKCHGDVKEHPCERKLKKGSEKDSEKESRKEPEKE